MHTRAPEGASKIDLEDPTTFATDNWPNRGKFLTDALALTYESMVNRTHPNLVITFSKIFGLEEKDLIVNVDAWGVMRPSIGHPEYRYNLSPHFDINPWNYLEDLEKSESNNTGYHMYQGVLHLNGDIGAGGFCVVPKCCGKNFKQWIEHIGEKRNDRNSYHPSENDPIYKCLQKVRLRPGCIVIWDSSGCHANYPNSSHSMRIVQYIKMMPKSTLQINANREKKIPIHYFEQNWNDPTLRNTISRLDQRQLDLIGLPNGLDTKFKNTLKKCIKKK